MVNAIFPLAAYRHGSAPVPNDSPGPHIRLGERIARLRDQQGISQRELCRRVSVSGSYLSKIERGINLPAPELLRVIARELGVAYNSLAILAGYADPEPGLSSSEVSIVVPADNIDDRTWAARLSAEALRGWRAAWRFASSDPVARETPPHLPEQEPNGPDAAP